MPNPSTICTAIIVPAQGKQQSFEGQWFWLWKVIHINGELLYHVHARNSTEAISFFNSQRDLFVYENKFERYILNTNFAW